MANPIWVDILLLLCFFLVLIVAFLYGWWCASGFTAFKKTRGNRK